MTISNTQNDETDDLLAEFRIWRSLKKTKTHQWFNYLWVPANDGGM